MQRRRQRRPDPKVTKVIAGAVLTGVVTVLNWLSQYSGGPLEIWQLPALTGVVVPTGWIVISQSGAASKRANYANFRLPVNGVTSVAFR
jgi:hypothetical protein